MRNLAMSGTMPRKQTGEIIVVEDVAGGVEPSGAIPLVMPVGGDREETKRLLKDFSYTRFSVTQADDGGNEDESDGFPACSCVPEMGPCVVSPLPPALRNAGDDSIDSACASVSANAGSVHTKSQGLGESDHGGAPVGGGCPCVCPYLWVPYDTEGRLRALLPENEPAAKVAAATGRGQLALFECNAGCACDLDCHLRLVQRGIPMARRFQLFPCGGGVGGGEGVSKGLGLRTMAPIGRGEFCCEYAGEVLDLAEAKRRWTRDYAAVLGTSNYVLVIREHVGGRVLNTVIDPTRLGSVGRFANHSCDPNLHLTAVRVNSTKPRACLFARRDIAAGEELTFDYSGLNGSPSNEDERTNARQRCKEERGEADSGSPARKVRRLSSREDTSSASSSVDNEHATPCLCGAVSCRGFLPMDPELATCRHATAGAHKS